MDGPPSAALPGLKAEPPEASASGQKQNKLSFPEHLAKKSGRVKTMAELLEHGARRWRE